MIEVLKPGVLSTIQDNGRFGFRNQGVPVSGVMDNISADFANALLNNSITDAVIEITLNGPKLLFKASTRIVITGAEMSPEINGNSIFNYHVYNVNDGDILSFGILKKGVRSYLSVQGGILSEEILGSKSYYPGITKSNILKKKDEIRFKDYSIVRVNNTAHIKSVVQFYETDCLEVYKGPDYNLFDLEEQNNLISSQFTISKDNDRMGYQLEEISIVHDKSILTGPVLPGTIQLTPGGKLIILMKDSQTTGGYPRVLQLTEKSIAILAQKKMKDKLVFKLIN